MRRSWASPGEPFGEGEAALEVVDARPRPSRIRRGSGGALSSMSNWYGTPSGSSHAEATSCTRRAHRQDVRPGRRAHMDDLRGGAGKRSSTAFDLGEARDGRWCARIGPRVGFECCTATRVQPEQAAFGEPDRPLEVRGVARRSRSGAGAQLGGAAPARTTAAPPETSANRGGRVGYRHVRRPGRPPTTRKPAGNRTVTSGG